MAGSSCDNSSVAAAAAAALAGAARIPALARRCCRPYCEAVGRVARKGDERRIEHVRVVLNEPADVVGAVACATPSRSIGPPQQLDAHRVIHRLDRRDCHTIPRHPAVVPRRVLEHVAQDIRLHHLSANLMQNSSELFCPSADTSGMLHVNAVDPVPDGPRVWRPDWSKRMICGAGARPRSHARSCSWRSRRRR